eukprot:349906-Chlamydomonas_euryale.AAC.4
MRRGKGGGGRAAGLIAWVLANTRHAILLSLHAAPPSSRPPPACPCACRSGRAGPGVADRGPDHRTGTFRAGCAMPCAAPGLTWSGWESRMAQKPQQGTEGRAGPRSAHADAHHA